MLAAAKQDKRNGQEEPGIDGARIWTCLFPRLASTMSNRLFFTDQRPLVQRASYSLGLIGVDCALCAFRHIYHIAPCAINSRQRFVICNNYISRASPRVGHGIFIRDIALRTPASLNGVDLPSLDASIRLDIPTGPSIHRFLLRWTCKLARACSALSALLGPPLVLTVRYARFVVYIT